MRFTLKKSVLKYFCERADLTITEAQDVLEEGLPMATEIFLNSTDGKTVYSADFGFIAHISPEYEITLLDSLNIKSLEDKIAEKQAEIDDLTDTINDLQNDLEILETELDELMDESDEF